MSLAHYDLTATDEAGNIIAGATVEVRIEVPGAPLASLYSDRDGATPMANPTTTDSNGYAEFFCLGGAHKVTVTSGALEKIRRYQAIGLNAEGDGIGVRTQRVVTGSGTATMATDDAQDLLIEGTISTVALCDPSLRANDVRIVDGSGDASASPITITVPTGKTLYGVLNGTTTIDGNGGSVLLTPREDGTGWY